jgi:dienelactone hydrolase
MSNISGKTIEYSYDSARLVGYFCAESTPASRPGVVLVHDAYGLGDHMKRTAERVAELGYAVLAADVWGDGAQLHSEAEIGPMIGHFADDRKTWMGRLKQAHATLAAQAGVDSTRIAFTGYCFGGTSVLEYLRNFGSEIKGVASFHGGLDQVGKDWSKTSAGGKALILTGYEDPIAPQSTLLELETSLTNAGVDWEINIYSHTKHAFTRPDAGKANNPQMVAYNPQSDRRSWAAMRRFLEEIFSA